MKMPMKKSNYLIMRDKMKLEFLKYDQENMIRKFKLNADSEFIYITLLGRSHRVSRHTGTVEWSDDGFSTVTEADYNVAMTIFDVLCKSSPDCACSGVYRSVNSLGKQLYSSGPGGSLFQPSAAQFASDPDALDRACRALGGTKYFAGDVAYVLPLFDFLPLVFQFWLPDDEFEAGVSFLWDENTLDFMHFETTFFAAGHVLERLRENMRQ